MADIIIIMNKLILIFTVLMVFTAIYPSVAQNMKDVESVEYVDINKYMGTWYEYARIPNRFQKKCEGNVTADYKLLPDGKVQVVNKCLEKNGSNDKAEGIAKIVDKKTNSKLKVSFFSIFGINLFWGNYWVLYIDEEYTIAVVGEPSRKYGWILTRDINPDIETLGEAYDAIEKNGYDKTKFILTKQGIKD